MPFVVDTVLNSNVFATRMLSKAKKWSGNPMSIPIKVSKNSTFSSFSGFDTFALTATDNRQKFQFYPKFSKITIVLPLDELSVNATEEGVIDLAAVELKGAAQDMADGIGTMFYGDGTGNGSKDITGLDAIVDDGTNTLTYGGLTRATYSPYISSTVTASSGTLSLAKMATLYNAVTSGSQKPTIGITTETVFSLYEQLLQPQERISKDVPMMKGGLVGGTGFTGLYYKGFPILHDEKCTSGALFFLNEDFLDFYALPMFKTEPVKYKAVDIKGNDYSDVLGLGFSWTNWIIPTNSASLVSHIYLGGELITTNPKRHGRLNSITSV
jgi:hypothetical protein